MDHSKVQRQRKREGEAQEQACTECIFYMRKNSFLAVNIPNYYLLPNGFAYSERPRFCKTVIISFRLMFFYSSFMSNLSVYLRSKNAPSQASIVCVY